MSRLLAPALAAALMLAGAAFVAVAALVSAGAAVTGTVGSLRRAAAMPPAEAMRPETPEIYRRATVERLAFGRRLDQPTRMILRHVERRPWKSLLTVAGISLACGIMMIGTFFTDALDHMVEIQFGLAQREDVKVLEAEIQAEVARIAEQFGKSPESLRLQMQKDGDLGALTSRIREDKVLDLLKANARLVAE